MPPESTSTFACPSCGAPLMPHGSDPEVKCEFCGTVVSVPENLRDHSFASHSMQSPLQSLSPMPPPEAQFNVYIQSPVITPDQPYPMRQRRSGGLGCFGTLIALILVGGLLLGMLYVARPGVFAQWISQLSGQIKSGGSSAPVIFTLDVNPTILTAGNSATVQWTASADSVKLDVPGTALGAGGSLPVSGQYAFKFEAVGTYFIRLTAVRGALQTFREVKVVVNPRR